MAQSTILSQPALSTYSDTNNTAMSTDAQAPPALDLAAMTFLRPAEIKTYHRETYDRIDPSTTFDGKDKTVLITGGGLYLLSQDRSCID
jgi:hypothetical protein